MSKYLTAAEIIAAKDVMEDDVEVPEWGGTVRIRELVASDRDWLQATMLTDQGSDVVRIGKEGESWAFSTFRVKLAALSIIDPETKKRCFSYAQVSELGAKSSVVIDRIVNAVFKLNKMGPDEEKKLGEDSGQTASDASSSVSPSP